MFIKKLIFLCASVTLIHSSGIKNLTLQQAIEMIDANNLELKISRFTEQMKSYETEAAKGHAYGKADITVKGIRSNDAGNVFGFKLQSREASFEDFGFSEFMGAINQGAQQANGDFGAFSQGLAQGGGNILKTQPRDLNFPDARNHFQTKITYMLPIYTGGKLSEYENITSAMQRMSKYDTQKLLNEKIFQTKKAFYDISLVSNYISHLSKIVKNIERLESIVQMMKKEGYAKDIDVLEVEARKAEVQSMYNQAKLNKDLAYQFLSFLLNVEVSSIKKVDDMAPMPYVDRVELESNNIDIQKALLGLQITQMAVNVEKANMLPTIGAFAEYGSADNTFWGDFTEKDAYTFGFQLNWNIFNGGIDAANLERAKVNYLKVQNQVELAKSGIALKVKKLQTEISAENSDVKSFEKQLHFAKKVYENYRARYKEGIVSISDVLIKQSKELELLLKLLTVKNKRNTKIFELNSILNAGGNV